MLPLLHEVLFEDERHRAVLGALISAGGDIHRATENADPMVAEHLARLAVEDTDADPRDVRRLLLRDHSLAVLGELEREARAATDIEPYARSIAWLKTRIEAVNPDAPPSDLLEDELLDWLAQRVEDER